MVLRTIEDDVADGVGVGVEVALAEGVGVGVEVGEGVGVLEGSVDEEAEGLGVGVGVLAVPFVDPFEDVDNVVQLPPSVLRPILISVPGSDE
jgi:hypothetical protein